MGYLECTMKRKGGLQEEFQPRFDEPSERVGDTAESSCRNADVFCSRGAISLPSAVTRYAASDCLKPRGS